MHRTAVVRLSCALLVLLGAVAAYTQNPPRARPFAADKIRDDLYMITGGGGNVPAYITSEGVVLVDAQTTAFRSAVLSTRLFRHKTLPKSLERLRKYGLRGLSKGSMS